MENQPLSRQTPYQVSRPNYSVSHQMVTTTLDLPGYTITQSLGVVRGIVVRTRNIFVNIGAAFQSLAGGNIGAWSKLCEQAREEAFDIMIQHASEIGANAIVGARYDATELSGGVTEVLAYGTAVVVHPNDGETSYRG